MFIVMHPTEASLDTFGLTCEAINEWLKEQYKDDSVTINDTDIPECLMDHETGLYLPLFDRFDELAQEYKQDALLAAIEYYGDLDEFEDRYLGQYDNGAEYARSFVEDCYDVPEFLLHYIDFNRLWNEMEEVEVGGYYFRS